MNKAEANSGLSALFAVSFLFYLTDIFLLLFSHFFLSFFSFSFLFWLCDRIFSVPLDFGDYGKNFFIFLLLCVALIFALSPFVLFFSFFWVFFSAVIFSIALLYLARKALLSSFPGVFFAVFCFWLIVSSFFSFRHLCENVSVQTVSKFAGLLFFLLGLVKSLIVLKIIFFLANFLGFQNWPLGVSGRGTGRI